MHDDVRDIVILGGVRTPIGAMKGALASLTAPQLGAIAIEGVLNRTGAAS
jgi:acetyl-CoA C-acetyltransferase